MSNLVQLSVSWSYETMLTHKAGLQVRVKTILSLPFVQALLFVHQKGEARYSELARLIRSRGTLSLVLKELEEDGLLDREVVTTKPTDSNTWARR